MVVQPRLAYIGRKVVEQLWFPVKHIHVHSETLSGQHRVFGANVLSIAKVGCAVPAVELWKISGSCF